MSATIRPAGVRRTWAHPVFRLALIGYALSSAAVGVSIVVVSVALFRRGGTTGWATLGVVARVAPFVLLSAIAGAVADRHDQRRTLQLAFVAQALIAGLLAVSVTSAPLAAIVALGFAANALWTIAYPSMAALLPRTVDDAELVTANGLLSTVESLAWIAGPGVGGLLVTAVGMRPTIAAQAVLALAGLGFATRARRASRATTGGDAAFAPPADQHRGGVIDGIRAGVRAVRSTPAVHHPLALLLLANLVYGALQVLMLVAAWKRLGMSEGGYGALCAGLGAGAFAALVIVDRVGRVARADLALAGAVVLSGGPVALLAVTSVPVVGVLLLAFSGLGLVLTEVLALSILQRNVPTGRVAGVFGLLDSLTVGAMLVGSVLAGPAIALLGLEAALVVVGAFAPVVAVLGVPLLLRRRTASSLAATPPTSAAVVHEVEVIAGGSSPAAAVRNFVINR